MEKILNEYCKQCHPGLLLLSMPTGFGKTYNVLNFIYSNYKEFAAENRKIFFITNLKKNLPFGDLKKRFVDNLNEDDFEKYVLFIDANFETVINNILAIEKEIPEQFKTASYFNLKRNVEHSQNKGLPGTVRSDINMKIRKELEPVFRKSIKDTLDEKFKTKEARLSAIKNNQDYQWIGKIYPAVFTDERSVLFLSIDKFLVKNTTLVEPSYYFHERLINKAVIFIDEFDSTKENILKNIIESGLRHRVDLLDLFLNIHNHLMQNECPEALLKESEWRKQKSSGGTNWPPLREQIELLRQKANEIFKEYQLQHTCKSYHELLTNKRNFLFHDYQFHYVLDRHKKIEIIKDLPNRTNWIKAVDSQTKGAGFDIRSMLNRITGFLTYFQIRIKYLAENYSHLKEEDKTIKETFPLESAITTVINNFRIDAQYVEFLINKIIENDLPYNLQTEQGTIQRQGFYDTGFRYHDIVDSDRHDTLSKIYMFNFSRTPESFLAGVCSKAMVVGISATAGLYTNIGNYDLEYLKSRLGDSFIRLKGDTLVKLKNAYSEATKGYDRVDIKTKFIGTNKVDKDESIKELELLLSDKETAQSLWNKLEYNSKKDRKNIEFCFSRYVRALTAWKYFLDHPDCHGFLCFFNKFPKDDDPEFDLHRLYEYAELLLTDRRDSIDDDISETIVVLSGDEFDTIKDKLLNDLKDNKRRFIFSTYQTIGVGQNLQFPIPSSLKPIQINDFAKNTDMDIDGIYLDLPTNLLVNIYNDDREDYDFIKYIFQLEFLRENGALSPNEFKHKLDEVFKRYLGIDKYKKKVGELNLYDTTAYSLFLNKVIIQAIGRICRTNMKAPTIHILADASIRKHLSKFYLPEDVIPVREYTALLKSAGESTNQSEDLREAQNRASNRSNQTAAYIRRQLNTPWQAKSVKQWQALRAQVLRQPAIAKELECDPKWNIIYLKLPKAADSYYFSHENDYDDVEVFFSDGCGKKQVKKVSEQTARLSDLMRIDLLKKLFIDSGWATAFPKSELILTPPIFNNIYKGALGEVCGKHIFETILKIPLLELEVDKFERFDFKTDQNIYIDFKFWNDRVAVPSDDLIDKIRDKMDSIGADRVFVINILGSSDTAFNPIISSDRKIVEVPYLCKNDKVDDQAIKFIREEFSR
ncbi:hypothetical protein [Limnofasciculus baicalensis]|uniref:Helicase/UvrB N-terminal domain-containing protein n=1 Tax=Limnofasciculus baicalensis BBK-W-15 TaxID=2699891 RepID=A0AAE3GV22_9CYAN|nr:hypothetical protein [Limnofasciculus baicalensis]MCP2730602.1 hypothetical protein [Limnofasciculus baicalensis BBK-W-15]